MRFLVLLGGERHFETWEAADEEVQARYRADYDAFADAVRARGSLLVGDALTHPDDARRLGPGHPRAITEGPFAETVEQLGGFYVVDLPDLQTAVDVAALLPQEHTVEVRPTLGIQV